MESLTVDLTIPKLVRELGNGSQGDAAVRIQLYRALEELVVNTNTERLGLDGMLHWALNRISTPEQSSAVEGVRQCVVQTCERCRAEVHAHFARSEAARAHFVYLHQLIQPHCPNDSPQTVSGQVGFVQVDLDPQAAGQPIRITNSNIQEDMQHAIRDAERAAISYLTQLGLRQHRAESPTPKPQMRRSVT